MWTTPLYFVLEVVSHVRSDFTVVAACGPQLEKAAIETRLRIAPSSKESIHAVGLLHRIRPRRPSRRVARSPSVRSYVSAVRTAWTWTP